jgi:hypothetical protein
VLFHPLSKLMGRPKVVLRRPSAVEEVIDYGPQVHIVGGIDRLLADQIDP